MLAVYALRTEHLENPLGIGERRPRLSWKLRSDRQDVMQVAYQVQAFPSEAASSPLWDTGRVESSRSHGLRYDGPELRSGQRVYWRVRVWDNHGQVSEFSEPAWFELGLLEAGDWQASWVEPEEEVVPDAYKPAPYIRKEFEVGPGLVRARAYLTARGLYRFYLNGIEATDELFAPGFTSYYHRLQVRTYDITALLREGTNAWGIILGDGWWRGSTGAGSVRNNFGYKLALLGQLVLEYADGSTQVVGTDASFKTSIGPLQKSDLKAGEVYDNRIVLDGWSEPGYDDSSWRPVQEVSLGLNNLVASAGPRVCRHERFHPQVLRTPNGETVLDFGQNVAGWVEMEVEGPTGTEVVLVHGEALDRDGNFTLRNLAMFDQEVRDFQEVHYILRGEGRERYEPHFAFFGFHYVLLRGYPGDVRPEDFTAIAIYSDLEDVGTFECSHPLINQLVSNARWSQKGNFLDIPTDCPTRERAGWTGDAQLYCKTATLFMDVYAFFEKWLTDLSVEQYPNGCVGNTVPNVNGLHNVEEWERLRSTVQDPFMLMMLHRPGEPSPIDGSAGWGDAAVIIPWTLYLCYGDREILERQYASAKAWVDYMAQRARESNELHRDKSWYSSYTDGELDANYVWDTGYHWGEWLEADLAGAQDDELREELERRFREGDPLVATAYLAHSAGLLGRIAEVLGKVDDAERYAALSERVKKVYDKHFVPPDGRILLDRQAPNVRTLAFDLASESKRAAVAARLDELVREKGYHLNTGFLSTPFLLPVLVDYGYADTAFRLLEQETCPSWLYAITKGATTIWEQWDAVSPEGEVSGSLNHYAYGAVCDFLFSYVVGIRPRWEAPGYRRFILSPLPGGSLEWARATFESPYGTIRSSWERGSEHVTYRFSVPANTRAEVRLPAPPKALDYVATHHPDARYEEGRVVFEVGSGEYEVTI